MKPGDRVYHVDEYTDETVPCDCTLEGWARWLASEDETWEHEVPADGETFSVSTVDVMAILRVTKESGAWTIHGDVPEGCTGFVCRSGREGWDIETWSETPLGHLDDWSDDWYGDGSEEELVCLKDGPHLVYRFEAAGPRLTLAGEQQ